MACNSILPYSFNMALGLLPPLLAMLTSFFLPHDTALYLSTALALVMTGVHVRRKGAIVPNFVLYISGGVLVLLSAAVLIHPSSIPSELMPLTLEASILIPMFVLYLNRERFIDHFSKQTHVCRKRLFAQGAEASVVSARLALMVGTAHFVAISLTMGIEYPLSEQTTLVLYRLAPPLVFALTLGLNQIAIRYFNHLMKHTEYLPIVNRQGEVVGKVTAMEAINRKNDYINPVVRIAFVVRGKLFLRHRPMSCRLDEGKADLPLECYLRYGESLTEGADRLMRQVFPQTEGLQPRFNGCHHFENEVTNRMIYLFLVHLDEPLPQTQFFKQGKLWCFKQIDENMGKGFFSHCFEEEYRHLKEVIDTREKYKEL